MDTDIDAQIRDILMKSTPINDNSARKPASMTAAIPAAIHNLGINVVGNQNIVVGTGFIQFLFLSSILAYCIMYLH